jgi:hypothetical protein
MRKPEASEICAQLAVTGGDELKQAAAKAVVSAAIAESLRLGPVVIESSGRAKRNNWNDPQMRKSPKR